MSLKDLFGKTSEKVVSNKNLQNLYDEVESEGYVEELTKDKSRYLPFVDFSSASNFARYGSAEKYYTDAIKNIYQRYPYDGSKKEKLEWKNASSQFDNYVFDNIYPKTTGYVNLGVLPRISSFVTGSSTYRSSSIPQYITIKGGPNQSTVDSNLIVDKYDTANIYDPDFNRNSNLAMTLEGNTVEFWFKDQVTASSGYENYAYCLFDLWNKKTGNSYSRLTLEKRQNKFLVTYRSGSSGITQAEISYTGSMTDWNHYAFVVNNSIVNALNLDLTLYVNSDLVSKQEIVNGALVNEPKPLQEFSWLPVILAR